MRAQSSTASPSRSAVGQSTARERRRLASATVVTTALAREVVGFLWVIASRAQPQPAA